MDTYELTHSEVVMILRGLHSIIDSYYGELVEVSFLGDLERAAVINNEIKRYHALFDRLDQDTD